MLGNATGGLPALHIPFSFPSCLHYHCADDLYPNGWHSTYFCTLPVVVLGKDKGVKIMRLFTENISDFSLFILWHRVQVEGG